MSDQSLPDVADFAAMSAKKRRFLLVLFGNVVMLVVMVGGPWLRGYLRARAEWREFARYGACLFEGKPNPEPGLGLPRGSEAHFAARVLGKTSDWPERCDALLRAVAPDEPIFLLPNVKRAEGDVRAAVGLVRKELSALRGRVPGERLSMRPLRALEHLRSALSRHAMSAGVVDVPEGEAFFLAPGKGLPIPTRVPLYTSSDARVTTWGADNDLQMLGIDHNGVSYVRVRGGALEQMRLPRAKVLDAYLRGEDTSLLIWAMPHAKCRERAGGCSQKTMGVAHLTLPLSQLPEPRWLGAHPAARVDRAVVASAGSLIVASESDERSITVREFPLPEEAEQLVAGHAELPPLDAVRTWPDSLHGEPSIVQLGGQTWVLVAANDGHGAQLSRLTPSGVDVLARLPAAKSAWITSAVCGSQLAFAFGTNSAVSLGTLSADSKVESSAAQPVAVSSAIHDADPALDRVRVVCRQNHEPLLFVRDDRDNLRTFSCDAAGCNANTVATGVTSFASLSLAGKGVLVAYAGSKNLAQLRMQTLDDTGATRVAEHVPAACWAPSGGMCGAPLLGALGARVLLGAREGTDMLMLVSPDYGKTFEPLRGLKKNE